MKNEIVLGIPGKWKSRTELVQSVARNINEGYILAGNIIYNSIRNVGFQVFVEEHDSNLQDAYQYASQGRFDDKLLNNIGEHTFTVYIISSVKKYSDLIEFIHVGDVLLQSGGLAVKIETTGTAHTHHSWHELRNNCEIFDVYCHFVTLIGDGDSFYSCGMKSFCLPDVLIPADIDAEAAAEFMNNFNTYHIEDSPIFQAGHTISATENGPVYKMSMSEDIRFDKEDSFHNPFGLITLSHD